MQKHKIVLFPLTILQVVVWSFALHALEVRVEGEQFTDGIGSGILSPVCSNNEFRFVHPAWVGSETEYFSVPKHGFYQICVAWENKDFNAVMSIEIDGQPFSGDRGLGMYRPNPFGIIELDAGTHSLTLYGPSSPATTMWIDYFSISDEYQRPFSTVELQIEGEELTSSVGSTGHDTQCSGGFYLQVNSGEFGMALGSFSVPDQDYYEIAVSMFNDDPGATISISIDGETITGFQGKGPYEPDSFGIVDLAAGTYSLVVNFPSAPATTVRLDCIRIRNYAAGPGYLLPPTPKQGKPIVVPEPKETEWGGGLYLMDNPAIVRSSANRDNYALAELEQFCAGLGFGNVPVLSPADNHDSNNLLIVIGDPTRESSSVTIEYQEDVSNAAYATTSDCWIQSDAGGVTDQGQRPEIRMRLGDRHALIAFRDIIGIGTDQIAPGTQIWSAKLKLYMYANYAGLDVNVYRVLKDWADGSEGTEMLDDIDAPGEFGSTWNSATEIYGGSNTAWDIAGCQGTGDRTQSPMDHVSVEQFAGSGIWVELDVTEAMQAWSNGGPNYGVFLECLGGNAYLLAAENGNDALNPILEVEYDPGSSGPSSPGTVGDYLFRMGAPASVNGLGEEGYILAVKRLGQQTVVAIASEGEAGVYYGALTFKQWPQMTPVGKYGVSEAVVRDWPSYKRRGLVGSTMNLTRLSLVAGLKENYSFLTRASKDWYNPIPQTEKDGLITYAQECAARFVTPVAGMKPDYSGPRLHYSDPAHINIMKQAYEDYYNCGYPSLWMPFDDLGNVGRNELYYADDIATFGHSGNAHKYLLQEVYNHLYSIDPDVVLYSVPMQYMTLDAATQLYLEQWGDLPDSVIVFNCTSIKTEGPDEFSPIFFESLIGRKPIIWDNYVTAYERLNPVPSVVPPLDNIGASPDLPAYSEGYSFPIVGDMTTDNMLYTLTADYMWNGLNYDAARSAMRARAMCSQESSEVVTAGLEENHNLTYGWTFFSTQLDDPVEWSSCTVTDGYYTFTAGEAAVLGWIGDGPYFFDADLQEYVPVSDDDGMLYWDTGYWIWCGQSGLTLTIK
jgi:beta-N-acetylglucosaminidase